TVAASKTEVDKTDTPATVRDKDYSVSLMFSQKLFDSGTTHLEIASARNKLKQAKLKYEYNLDLVEASMREALSNYSEAVWRTQAAEKSAEYADENMRLIRERFEAGEAGIVELIDAQILMTDTKMSELKAYFDERAMLGRIYVNMDKTERLWELADEKR
ncbi:MAG: TolC family protein, partial [Candidatus Muiribacteriaceae bacterium]